MVAALRPAAAPPPRFPAAAGVHVPDGFVAQVYARGLAHPTALAFGPGGVLYATEEGGLVVAVPPNTRSPRVVASGFLDSTLGLAFAGRTLFVSTKGRLDRLELRRGRVVSRRTIVSQLPNKLHQQDNVVVHGGRIYFGNGSTCNACAETDPRSATVLSVRPNGTGLQIEARGLRNPFGLALDARTGRIYVSVNGRDDLGPDEPADAVVLLRRGANYGWPDCWPSYAAHALRGSCAGVTPPNAYLEPHSSADGIVVYRGRSFPRMYSGNLFVAEWGQYDSTVAGRKVVRIAGDRVSDFVTGLPHPLAVAVDRYGALLVADWERGTIYRIQARGKP